MSQADKFTQSFKKQVYYSDFFTDLSPHPETLDLVRNVNELAIKRALKNLFNTDPGERWFNPSLGSNIRKYLFEPIDPVTTQKIKLAVAETIEKHERRIKLLNLEVTPDEARNGYTVSLQYLIQNTQQPITTDIVLTRVR